MKSTKSSPLYLIGTASILGVAFLGYMSYNYFSHPKTSQISEELTRKILQEVKHQMLITCINFTNEMHKRAGSVNFADPQTLQFLRSEMGKIYQQKENLVLSKYNLTSVSYAKALTSYAQSPFVKDASNQIIDMMEKAISGRIPDLTVKPEAKAAFSRQQLREIYYELCQKIVGLVLNRLKQCQREDPSFDSKDDQSFRVAIRSLSIYDYKVNFLRDKGFEPAWGCPNQVFFKLIESHKHQNPLYKEQVILIQKAYEKAIEQISRDPSQVTEETIHIYFKECDPNPRPQQGMAENLNDKEPIVPTVSSGYRIPTDIQRQQHDQVNILTSLRSDTSQQHVPDFSSKLQQQSFEANNSIAPEELSNEIKKELQKADEVMKLAKEAEDAHQSLQNEQKQGLQEAIEQQRKRQQEEEARKLKQAIIGERQKQQEDRGQDQTQPKIVEMNE